MDNFTSRKKAIYKLSVSLIILMIIQSLGGLLIPGLYTDSREITASWLGNDLVTLMAAVPVMLYAVIYSQKGSVFAQYTWLAMLFYVFYNNCYYLFGASLNYYFFIYIAIAVLSAMSLFIAAAQYDRLDIEKAFRKTKLLKPVVISSLLIFGSLMAGMWIKEWIGFALNGTRPVIPGMDEGYSLVAAMDLTTQIPVIFIGAILLWRDRPLGYLLSFIATISNTVYVLVLVVFCPIAERAGLPKAWDGFYLFSFILLLCLASSIMFYRSTNETGNKK